MRVECSGSVLCAQVMLDVEEEYTKYEWRPASSPYASEEDEAIRVSTPRHSPSTSSPSTSSSTSSSSSSFSSSAASSLSSTALSSAASLLLSPSLSSVLAPPQTSSQSS